MRGLLFSLLFLILVIVQGDNIYERIPKYQVDIYIVRFFNMTGMNNCFQNIVDENLLFLKCLKRGDLYDVIIQVHPTIYSAII